MAGFSHYMIDKYLKKLQEAGYTVVVFTQDEQNKNTTRSLAGIYSPGTYFSPDSAHITNNTTCIWINVIELIRLTSTELSHSPTHSSTARSKSITSSKYFTTATKQQNNKMVYVGLANIDVYTGKTSIFEFKETYINNPTTFDELERFISIYNPSEVIVIANVTNKEIDDIISYGNIQSKSIHKINLLEQGQNNTEMINRVLNSEKQNYQKMILEKFYNVVDFEVFSQNFYENTIATQAFCFLLDFIYQHNPNLVNKISEPKFENCSDRLILANHSLKQLNIIDDNNYTGKYSSVEKMLNICITSMGKRKFAYNLLNPTTNTTYLQREYDITEHMLIQYSKYEIFKNKLGVIKDISKIVRQIVMKKISPSSFFQLYKNLHTIKEIYSVAENDDVLNQYLTPSATAYGVPSLTVAFGYGSLQNTATTNKNINNNTTNKNNNKQIVLFCNRLIEFLDKNLVITLCEDVDTCQQFETNFFKTGVDKELDEKTMCLTESNNKLESIRQYFNNCILKYEKNTKTTDYVKIHETEKNNFSLLATKRRCNILKQHFTTTMGEGDYKGVLLDYMSSDEPRTFLFKSSLSQIKFETQSASNDCISSSQIDEICKNISTIKIQMKDILSATYVKFLEKMETFEDEFDTIIEFITSIDVIFAKATIAKKYNYCKPTLVNANKSFVNAQNMRHCLIEHLQQNELYISNDISLGTPSANASGVPSLFATLTTGDFCCAEGFGSLQTPETSVDGVLLYGTNAVGKTSFIRSLGIAVIMAQAGLYVPCSSFHFQPYKYIFTRILGNDNIFKGLSTFAVEMSELRTILRLADDKSLVLGDELCSGTESISAVSIFVAGIQNLHKKGCSFIFATHLHEIIHYEEIMNLETVVLKHMAVIYDRAKDILVYDRKLRDGPGDNMYGLEVCRSLNLPEDFLTSAHNIRMKYNPGSNSVLSFKPSHYNAKKIVGICELCKIEMGSEVHHLQHQRDANDDGNIINNEKNMIFQKNNASNLLTLCEACHTKIHKETGTHKKVKTSKGLQLLQLTLPEFSRSPAPTASARSKLQNI
jgi:DNA mismatch repair protein MutS